jgi:hypothetical protein
MTTMVIEQNQSVVAESFLQPVEAVIDFILNNLG